MSSTRERKLHITDESGDSLEVQTVAFDDEVDWTDDSEAILAAVKPAVVQEGLHVNLSRADLRELRDFLTEILDLDTEENF